MRGVILGVIVGLLLAGCIVRNLVGPRTSGTCRGACAHYVDCKHGGGRDTERCNAECPDVFADRDSLIAFENLSCRDAVEFVDGSIDPGHKQAARGE
jgi:hypothetical protein